MKIRGKTKGGAFRTACFTVVSLVVHLVFSVFLFLWIASFQESPGSELFVLDLVELPAPPPEEIPQKITPEPQVKVIKEQPRRKARRARKRRGQFIVHRTTSGRGAKMSQSEPEPVEQPQQEQPRKLPTTKLPNDFSDFLRRQGAKKLAEQGEAEFIQNRVQAVAEAPRSVEARINDLPETPELDRDEEGNYLWNRHGLYAKIRPDGTVDFRLRIVEMLDLTDLLYLAHGDDPRTVLKLWFLKHTVDLRDRLSRNFHNKLLVKSPTLARKNILRVWSDGSLSMAEKRRHLFDLWDECSDTKMGQKIRSQIVHFIRQKLPAESTDAFTPQEIGAFNASRYSKQRFWPYPGSAAKTECNVINHPGSL